MRGLWQVVCAWGLQSQSPVGSWPADNCRGSCFTQAFSRGSWSHQPL